MMILTPQLLGALIEQGYTHCLSKTICTFEQNTSINIILTPVKKKPKLTELPIQYDTYFQITREPLQMSYGVDDTRIHINLNDIVLKRLLLLYSREEEC